MEASGSSSMCEPCGVGWLVGGEAVVGVSMCMPSTVHAVGQTGDGRTERWCGQPGSGWPRNITHTSWGPEWKER